MSEIKDIDLNNDGIADADINRDGIVTEEEIELYRKHIVKYFDTQLNDDILNLQQSDKEKLFQMFTDYADILEKILHPGIPIIEHILGKPWQAAKDNPHEGINWDYECEIVKQYEQWKSKK
jgi:hypothetical protein